MLNFFLKFHKLIGMPVLNRGMFFSVMSIFCGYICQYTFCIQIVIFDTLRRYEQGSSIKVIVDD